MKKKKYLVFILLPVVSFLLLLPSATLYKNQANNLRHIIYKIEAYVEMLAVPTDKNYFSRAGLPEKFDYYKIGHQVIDSQKQNLLYDPRFSIPTTIGGIKMMSEDEKKELGLEQYEDVQVLTLDYNGPIAGYQIINTEEDFIFDQGWR